MTISCDNVKTLLTSYLDGELSEEQSAPLRTHLLDCRDCRETTQEGKVIRRWFSDGQEPVEVPQGFAAHVARRAFAGDPGLLEPTPPQPKPLLTFVVGLSAVAAALLFAFSLFIQQKSLPDDDSLGAQDRFWEEAPEEVLEVPATSADDQASDDEDSDEDAR